MFKIWVDLRQHKHKKNRVTSLAWLEDSSDIEHEDDDGKGDEDDDDEDEEGEDEEDAGEGAAST